MKRKITLHELQHTRISKESGEKALLTARLFMTFYYYMANIWSEKWEFCSLFFLVPHCCVWSSVLQLATAADGGRRRTKDCCAINVNVVRHFRVASNLPLVPFSTADNLTLFSVHIIIIIVCSGRLSLSSRHIKIRDSHSRATVRTI